MDSFVESAVRLETTKCRAPTKRSATRRKAFPDGQAFSRRGGGICKRDKVRRAGTARGPNGSELIPSPLPSPVGRGDAVATVHSVAGRLLHESRRRRFDRRRSPPPFSKSSE